MYICNECGQLYAEPVSVCTICGCNEIKPDVVEPIIPPVTPDFTATAENNSVPYNSTPYESIPHISGATRAKGIIGFIMAIEGIAGAAMYAAYAFLLVFMIFGYADEIYNILGNSDMPVYATGIDFAVFFCMVYLIFQIILGIISVSLCRSAIASGYVSKLTSTGKKLGILTIVISSVAVVLLFIAFLAL